jgi:PAS domain S-box-containing protein
MSDGQLPDIPLSAESTAEDIRGRLDILHSEIEQLHRCCENVISALPLKLLVLDEEMRVVHCNPAYYIGRGLTREEIRGRHISEIFPHSLLEEAGLREAMLATLRTGERVRWSGYRQATADHGERIVNIRLDPCEGPRGEPNLLLTIDDVTERHRELYERRILGQITRAMLGQLELPRLLHAILTGMTAGGAAGLGFNRAILLLADEQEGVLKAAMAVGPENREQAATIWSKLADQHHTLDDFIAAYDQLPPPHERPLWNLMQRLVFPLSETSVLPMSAIAGGTTVHVEDAANDPAVTPELRKMLGVNEFVVAPLVARGKTIGAAIADNFITLEPIGHADIQLLTVLADQAALSIDSARMYQEARERALELDEAYRQLQEAHQERVRSEKLATIGRVAAIVAHEIRNPLATIGGFARAIANRPDLIERSRQNAQVIVEEVRRLEGILGGLLDFTKPRPPQPAPTDLRALATDTLGLLAKEIQGARVRTRLEFDERPVTVSVDEPLIRQVLINLVKNAVEAMPDGGTLTVGARRVEGGAEMWVGDTGPGVPGQQMEQIFDAFYTTKTAGTGLGLAMSRQIVADHGAKMTVSSEPGQGTTFRITFPSGPQADPNGAVPSGGETAGV